MKKEIKKLIANSSWDLPSVIGELERRNIPPERVVINRIAIRIESKKHLIIFDNVYCGGIYGTDRIYEVLYQLDTDLYKLVNGNYGHLNKLTDFRYWDDLFYSLFCIKEV